MTFGFQLYFDPIGGRTVQGPRGLKHLLACCCASQFPGRVMRLACRGCLATLRASERAWVSFRSSEQTYRLLCLSSPALVRASLPLRSKVCPGSEFPKSRARAFWPQRPATFPNRLLCLAWSSPRSSVRQRSRVALTAAVRYIPPQNT